MSDDRIPLQLEQVAELRRAVRGREQAIVDGVLQSPDYPPLPACPQCGTTPEKISEWQDVGDDMLIDFKPCGHRFRVDLLAVS